MRVTSFGEKDYQPSFTQVRQNNKDNKKLEKRHLVTPNTIPKWDQRS
jgi:hypothetical protein